MPELGNKQKIVLQFVDWAQPDDNGKPTAFRLVLDNIDEEENHVGMYSGLEITGFALMKKDQVLNILERAAKPGGERVWPLFTLTIVD